MNRIRIRVWLRFKVRVGVSRVVAAERGRLGLGFHRW